MKVAISCGFCTHTLDLTQNLVKILVWEHKIDLTAVAAEQRQLLQLVAMLSSILILQKSLLVCCRQGEMSFHHIHSEHALLLFWAVEQTEAMGMSTAVKENQTTQHFGS